MCFIVFSLPGLSNKKEIMSHSILSVDSPLHRSTELTPKSAMLFPTLARESGGQLANRVKCFEKCDNKFFSLLNTATLGLISLILL